jgi:hypothetical protein
MNVFVGILLSQFHVIILHHVILFIFDEKNECISFEQI